MNLLDKLDRLMEQQNLNKHSLAEKSNIPYTTIVGLYQKDPENIRVGTIKRLAMYFGVSMDYLLKDEIHEEHKEPKLNSGLTLREHELIRMYRGLDENRKKILEYLIKEEYKMTDFKPDEDYRQVARGSKARLQAEAAQKTLQHQREHPKGDVPDWDR